MLCSKRCHACNQQHSPRVVALLPVDTVNSVHTLKAWVCYPARGKLLAFDGTLLHGEAVGIGMIAALELGVAEGVTNPGLPTRIRNLLQALGLPTSASGLSPESLAKAFAGDKKISGSNLSWVFVEEVGRPTLAEIPLGRLGSWLELFQKCGILRP